MTQHMKFENERGAGISQWVALFMFIVVVGWMASGFIFPQKDADADEAKTAADSVKLVTVAVRDSVAQPVVDVFLAEGQTAAKKTIAIRPETGGSVAEVLVAKGDVVAEGQPIARIDAAQRIADLQRVEADLARAQREFDNAQELRTRGVATNDRVVAARSALAAAKAAVANSQQAMEDLDIVAPISGILENFTLEVGEFLSPGVALGSIVELDPLTVTVAVPQHALGGLKVGQMAQVEFITGEKAQGNLSYISSVADAQTRTFVAEITVENSDGKIPAGISAEAYIPTGERQGHFLSPAILSLNTDGVLGVKAVDAADVITFYPVEIIRAELDGVWVSGLPDELKLVTIGQGFVDAGEVVDPQPEDKVIAANTAKEDG